MKTISKKTHYYMMKAAGYQLSDDRDPRIIQYMGNYVPGFLAFTRELREDNDWPPPEGLNDVITRLDAAESAARELYDRPWSAGYALTERVFDAIMREPSADRGRDIVVDGRGIVDSLLTVDPELDVRVFRHIVDVLEAIGAVVRSNAPIHPEQWWGPRRLPLVDANREWSVHVEAYLAMCYDPNVEF